MDKKNLFSVIIPVYNSEKSLKELCLRISGVFENTIHEDYEVILVNDASKDGSWEIMQQLHRENPKIKIINLSKNCGQHSAMLCGLNNFKGDYVIFIDDDLQHPPEEIPKLINHIENNPGIDVVIGSFVVKKHSFIRNLGSTAMKIVAGKIYKSQNNFRFTNFRILRGNIARAIADIRINKPRIGQMILLTTNKISSVNVEHDERKYGKSGYTLSRLIKDFLINIIYNSSLPLKIISIIGICISMLSFLVAAYFMGRYFTRGTSVQGWTSLMVLTSFFSGFILFSLGLIGEYLIRILMETKKLPNYVEREKYF